MTTDIGPGVQPYTMEKAARAAARRNRKAEEKAPLLALVGDVKVWSPEEVFNQATQIGRNLEDTLREMRERDLARIAELESAILKVVPLDEFARWKAIKRSTPLDLIYQCDYLFKYLAVVDPPTAWQLCLHAKNDWHTFLGLSYKACPVCKKPLDQRKGVFWFASYLLSKKYSLGYLFDDAHRILEEAEVTIFVDLCNRLVFEMKSPSDKEIEQLLADECRRKEVLNDQPIFTTTGARQPSLHLAEPAQ